MIRKSRCCYQPVLNDEKERQRRIKKDEELVAEKQKKSDLKSDKDGEEIEKEAVAMAITIAQLVGGNSPQTPLF